MANIQSLRVEGNFLVLKDKITSEEFDFPLNDFRHESKGNVILFMMRSQNSERKRYLVSELEDPDNVAFANKAEVLFWIRKNTGNNKPDFVANETNVVAIYLKNGSSEDQAVDGSVTPVEFSYAPPPNFEFIIARVVFYMEGAGTFDANLFGDQVALTNGWTIEMNGVETMVAKTNKDLGTYMYDMKGDEIYGKVNRTIIGRFSFNKFTDGADGITIRNGQSFKTIVKDNLLGLTFLEAKIMGVLKRVKPA